MKNSGERGDRYTLCGDEQKKQASKMVIVPIISNLKFDAYRYACGDERLKYCVYD